MMPVSYCFDVCLMIGKGLALICERSHYLFILNLSDNAECGEGLVCYQRRANEEVPFCYGVALVDRDYCSLPVQGNTSPAATVTGRAGIMAATTAVAVGIAVMFA